MPSGDKNKKQFKLLRWLIPFLISLAGILFVYRQINSEQLSVAFSKLESGTIVKMLFFFVIGQLFRALSLKIILGTNFSFKAAFFSMNAGYLLNNVLPFRIGEIGRSLLLTGEGKDRGRFMEIFGAVITERVWDVFLAASFFLLTLPLVVKNEQLRLAALIAFGLTFLFMITAAVASAHLEKIDQTLKKVVPQNTLLQEKIFPKLLNLLESFSLFRQPSRFLFGFGALMISWFFAMAEMHMLQQALIPRASWWWTAFAISASAFVMALPSAPAGIGVYEAATVSAYSLLGVDAGAALTIALILHVSQVVLSSGLGLAGVYILGGNLNDLIKRATRRTDGGEA
ncbi:MAG: lysylphosphatidylglycerol synthase transmembrane domain-containing protein [Anaerolineaceae bacterium]|jgi:uncharacterized protein (TIRG00374 family)